MRRSPNWSTRIDNILNKTQHKFDRFKLRNFSADNTADLSFKQFNTMESQPYNFSKHIEIKSFLNTDESGLHPEIKAYIAEVIRDREYKTSEELCMLNDRLAVLEEGRANDMLCTNEVIARVQEIEAKITESYKRMRAVFAERTGRGDERDLKISLQRFEALRAELSERVEDVEGEFKLLEARLGEANATIAELGRGLGELSSVTQSLSSRKSARQRFEASISAKINEICEAFDRKIAGLMTEKLIPLERSFQSRAKTEDSFQAEQSKTIEIYETHESRLSLIEDKLEELSNRVEDIEIRTIRLDMEEIIQKQVLDKDEFSEALATFGKQDEFIEQKRKASPDLVTMSLNDLGESDVESNGLMSPNLSPLNRFEQAHPFLAAKLKRFVFGEDNQSSIEEVANEEELPSPNYSMRVPPHIPTLGKMSDRLMIQPSDRYSEPIDSEDSKRYGRFDKG